MAKKAKTSTPVKMTSFEFVEAIAKDKATSRDYLEQANDLALRFYLMMGYRARDGYLMYKATHPQECLCWDMAVMVMRDYFHTEMDDVLSDVEED